MAELGTIARPYAQAVYELAKDTGQLPQWSEQLDFAAAVASDNLMQGLLLSPRFSPAQLEEMFIKVCEERLTDQGRNMIRLLAENRRLHLLPQIAKQFADLRAAAEKTLQARLISAQPVEPAAQEKLAEALGKRLDVKVTLTNEIDAGLLGGAVIRAGDLVIDGSVRGRLERLAAGLNR
ncbi:F0F1 ATP synthase subunit delta [Alkalilimnicola ehrlichii]|uniref:ATP synthase subunit delta n=1 Tax=Alkalilimnicola ehrlichii TaxID=351052 RepID=A0A3E0WYW7_9GAMM|nr:F0F1 ATP synthase subunit delta [Alkalilimnicola ehrlichii]RFA30637.1 F0F1 ATP synthase subunit delta [Alkalilimnicola ehrlichii]RFA38218.1 F0F1 ATP synthase subunit delta [Alkalilimnicola ehrlichii]